MHSVRNVTKDLYWVGANDHRLALFENIHPIPEGVSYNSYLLLDDQSVLFDTIDWSACRQLLENIEYLLKGKPLDVLVINHMEPDHGASIEEILLRYPKVEVISTEKSFMLMRQFGFHIDGHKLTEVKEGDTRCFGKHTVAFVEAPMVHWPEAMVTFDTTDGVLFSADAFGSFIALDGKLFSDEVNFDRDWIDEARRYYTNIVGKYGPHVMDLLGKAIKLGLVDGATLEPKALKCICPLHGTVWRKPEEIKYILGKQIHWSTYEPEDVGDVMIVYASMYGNTESAAQALALKLAERGVSRTKVYDVSNTHVSYLISEAFRVSHIVVASVTYNLGIYPVMKNFLEDMKALNMQKRTFAIVENGSWAPESGDLMEKFIDEELKMMDIITPRLSLSSALKGDKEDELNAIADAIAEDVKKAVAEKKG